MMFTEAEQRLYDEISACQDRIAELETRLDRMTRKKRRVHRELVKELRKNKRMRPPSFYNPRFKKYWLEGKE